MDPVDINSGSWYLRALRADDRMDDRPALAELNENDPDYIRRTALGWTEDVRYTWAVCEPTTGEMLAEVTLSPSTGTIETRARPGHAEAAQTAAAAVGRFAEALDTGSE
jgi:hypothetical protein